MDIFKLKCNNKIFYKKYNIQTNYIYMHEYILHIEREKDNTNIEIFIEFIYIRKLN